MKPPARLVLLLFALLPVAASAVEVATPAGLNPGDTFRLVFVTDGTYRGISPDAQGYDGFVNDDVAAAGGLTYGDQAIVWQALVATINGYVYGLDLPLARVPSDSATPIYRLDGQKVADSGADFWDGTLQNPINLSPSYQTINAEVWTGFRAEGWFFVEALLGSPYSLFGLSSETSDRWAGEYLMPTYDNPSHIYAVSAELTVIPEPAATTALISAGALVFATLRRRRAST